jgi:uncharacterized protein
MRRSEALTLTVPVVDGSTLQLRARWVAGERCGVVVAPPHPEYGGSIDNPVVSAIERGFQRAQVTTLAFNFRGVDGSEGRATGDLDAAVQDYSAAHSALVERTGNASVWLAGYSFGAGAAVLLAREVAEVRGLVLVAPPVGMLRAEDLAVLRVPLLVIVGDEDEYAPVSQLQEVLGAAPQHELQVVVGADHFFHFGGLPDIERRITEHVRSVLG